MRKITKTNVPKVMYIVPNIIGFTGDVINEIQLAEALTNYSFVEIYSTTPLLKIRKMREFIKLAYQKKLKKIILMPIMMFPNVIGTILSLLISFQYVIIAILKKPDLIYIRTSILALPFLWLRRLHKAKVIVKIPAIIEDELKYTYNKSFMFDIKLYLWLNSLADKYALTHANWVAIPSPLLYLELCKRRHLKPTKPPILVPAGINLNKIKKIKNLKANNMIKNNNEFVIGFIGLLTWWQGVDILVNAIREFSRICNISQYNIKLLIVGDGPERKKIETLCRELFINCKIMNSVPHEIALEILSSLDALVVPRLRTPVTESVIPIKVIEAWALGVPVIITKHRVFEVLGLRDGEDLIYCEPHPSSVAEAICRLIRDPSLRTKLSSAGPKLAEIFNYDFIARKLLRYIKT